MKKNFPCPIADIPALPPPLHHLHCQSRGSGCRLPCYRTHQCIRKYAPSNRINVGAIGAGRITRIHDLPGIWKYDQAHHRRLRYRLEPRGTCKNAGLKIQKRRRGQQNVVASAASSVSCGIIRCTYDTLPANCWRRVRLHLTILLPRPRRVHGSRPR